MNNVALIAITRLHELLDYDCETGTFTWRVGRRRGIIAGCKNNRGYHCIKIDRVIYLAHRLAFAHFHGRWPSNIIDHADGNYGNNAIVNLREATSSQNRQNCKARTDSRSGLKGAVWVGRENKWQARIRVNGKNKTIGSFDSAEEAHMAYAAVASLSFGEFARSA